MRTRIWQVNWQPGFIRGLEAQGVGTSLKHFAANSQELDRFTSDSILDGRTLRELYLTAFEIAVREGSPAAVMCAYPKLNGVHCSDSKELLTDILRTEWGFDGMVVTDWGAMNDRIAGFPRRLRSEYARRAAPIWKRKSSRQSGMEVCRSAA